MFCTNTKWCDFFICTKDTHTERILYNDEFCSLIIPKLKCFYFCAILPELVVQHQPIQEPKEWITDETSWVQRIEALTPLWLSKFSEFLLFSCSILFLVLVYPYRFVIHVCLCYASTSIINITCNINTYFSITTNNDSFLHKNNSHKVMECTIHTNDVKIIFVRIIIHRDAYLTQSIHSWC